MSTLGERGKNCARAMLAKFLVKFVVFEKSLKVFANFLSEISGFGVQKKEEEEVTANLLADRVKVCNLSGVIFNLLLGVQPHVGLPEPGELLDPQQIVDETVGWRHQSLQPRLADDRRVFQGFFCLFLCQSVCVVRR